LHIVSASRRLPYESNLPFFLITFHEPSSPHDPIPPCPRSLLASTVDKIRAYTPSSSSSSAFSSAPSSSEEKSSGWECMAGVEYEYFQFKETAESLVEKKWVGLNPLTPGMHGYSVLRPLLNNDYYHALHDKAEEFGIPVEAHRSSGLSSSRFQSWLLFVPSLRNRGDVLVVSAL
jgi:glutamine synthetase